jgi:hypothetical protein
VVTAARARFGPPQRGSIWLYALGYFACYVPYAALTKAASSGLLVGGRRLGGVVLLPISVLASALAMIAFLTWRGWWRYADQRVMLGRSFPVPDGPTAASGLATAVVIATTTLSYTLPSSILLMMVLMRGGVLVIAPVVDVVAGRRVRSRAWLALGLSLLALLLGLGGSPDGGLGIGAIACVAAYLAGYFVRLRAMSAQAKTTDDAASIRFFVQEQMVATPALLLFLLVAAVSRATPWSADLAAGILGVGDALPWVIAIGVLSQGTGVFGALVLLDGRENAFCVPVNRASSVLAGLVGSAALALLLDMAAPSASELAGAGLLVAALLVLGWPKRSSPPQGRPSRLISPTSI